MEIDTEIAMGDNARNHKLFKVNQNAILKNEAGNILILKKDDKWMLPGGRMEEGETWLEGLRREVQEETGIEKFSVEKILNVDTRSSGNTYIVTFLCKTEGVSDVKLSDEHQDFEWLKMGDIDKYEFWVEAIKDRLKLVLQNK